MKTTKQTLKTLNTGNAFEKKTRMEKVLGLYMSALNFASASDVARKNTATLLRTFSQPDRDAYATAHGVESPSTITWEMFCVMVEG